MLKNRRDHVVLVLSFTSTNLPPSFVHNLTITRNRVAVRVSGYGWRGDFSDISSNMRAEPYN